jgi:hypothetical protein
MKPIFTFVNPASATDCTVALTASYLTGLSGLNRMCASAGIPAWRSLGPISPQETCNPAASQVPSKWIVMRQSCVVWADAPSPRKMTSGAMMRARVHRIRNLPCQFSGHRERTPMCGHPPTECRSIHAPEPYGTADQAAHGHSKDPTLERDVEL